MLKETTRIIRFMIVGFSNALIAMGVVLIMMEIFDFDYIVSNITGYTTALINNFFWSKYWVFTSRNNRYFKEVPLFLMAFAAAYGSQFLTLLLMVEVLDLNEYLAQFLGLFVYGSINFMLNRKVTFRNKN